MRAIGISLVIQWLRLHASNARGMDSVLAQGTRTPNAVRGSRQKKKKKNEGNKTQKQRDWEHILLGIRDFSLLFPNLSAILSKQWQKLSCVGTSGVQLFDHNPPDFFVEVLPPWTVPPSLA